MALPFSRPPEMGLSGPRMTGCAGASPSDLTAGPPSPAPPPATATGKLGPPATGLSSDASMTGAALLTRLLAGCCAALLLDAGGGLGCAGALACALVLARAVCVCAGDGEGCATGCVAGDVAGCAAGDEAGCDIFAMTVSSR